MYTWDICLMRYPPCRWSFLCLASIPCLCAIYNSRSKFIIPPRPAAISIIGTQLFLLILFRWNGPSKAQMASWKRYAWNSHCLNSTNFCTKWKRPKLAWKCWLDSVHGRLRALIPKHSFTNLYVIAGDYGCWWYVWSILIPSEIPICSHSTCHVFHELSFSVGHS